ncbi:thioredoxin family protein [Hymenobacter arizonensis]|uniref:Thioredoxin n=1 Tax=Hymenobacter arizonensis TaxID=1227077 RepID=A0A1I5THC3_HYMAR|nr:thioredoxin family protein [Hymenobacter arizonensis]SFP82251.1 Thioredoxin [Hymenobacter arizonensis]
MLEKNTSMALVDTNDEGLRIYVHSKPKVFAIFTTTGCQVCKVLEPIFSKLVGDKLSIGIQFVRLDSGENPVAKRLMAEQEAPFFVSYSQGRMLECGTCVNEKEMLEHLTRLRGK